MYAISAITPGVGSLPGPFGQLTWEQGGPITEQVDAITEQDIIKEFSERGYVIQAPGAPVPPTAPAGITKQQAISIAVDDSINSYELPHTTTRPFMCPGVVAADVPVPCSVPASWWPDMITYTTMIANGFYTGKYSIPAYLAGIPSSLSGGTAGGLGNAWETLKKGVAWIDDRPYLYDLVGDMAKSRAQYLTAKDIKDTLQSLIPSDVLTKEDMPAIMEAFRQKDVIGPGQDAAFQKGLEAATMTTPSWMMPVLIAGGALVVFMLMRK